METFQKNSSKIYDFSLTEIGNKRKIAMIEPTESVILRGQQKFDLHDILDHVDIDINEDRILTY